VNYYQRSLLTRQRAVLKSVFGQSPRDVSLRAQRRLTPACTFLLVDVWHSCIQGGVIQ
jgi:hypothetical protein